MSRTFAVPPRAAPEADPVLPPTLTSFAPAATNGQLLKWMFTFLRPVKLLACLACLWVAIFIGAEVLAVKETGRAISLIQKLHTDRSLSEVGFWAWMIGTHPDAAALRHILLVLGALVGVMSVVRYLRETSNMRMSMNMVYYLREAVYDKLQRVGLSFHDVLSSGQLINRALSDLQNVRAFVQTAMLTSLDIVLTVGGYILLVTQINGWLAALSLVPIPIWVWYILRFGKKVQPVAKAMMEAGDRNVSLITESVAGVHVVKAFATEQHEISKYNDNCDTYFSRVQMRIRLFANFTPIIRIIAMASHLSLFLGVAVLVIRGDLNAGDFLVLGAAMGSILGKLQQVATINEQYQDAIVSARRLYEVLHARPTVMEKEGAPALPRGRGAVTFEHVTFGYDPARAVLKDVSFSVPEGKVVAIVGPTGAGKSTLVNLIARFYDPQHGRVLIDGVDVRDCSLSSLRTQISFVFQETYLFSQSAADNISYGRPNISPGEIEAAARLSQAHDFIEQLPKGYDTVLAERGSSLSGGQKQRMAIARAILTNPRILILDDATAAVDPETEDLIRKAMRFVMFERTTFVIAHRISTVKAADLVLVLENGLITQQGTHDELMEQEGHYKYIASVQLYGDDDGPGEKDADSPSHMRRVRDSRKLGIPSVVAQPGSEQEI